MALHADCAGTGSKHDKRGGTCAAMAWCAALLAALLRWRPAALAPLPATAAARLAPAATAALVLLRLLPLKPRTGRHASVS